jgi:hypothetical protein
MAKLKLTIELDEGSGNNSVMINREYPEEDSITFSKLLRAFSDSVVALSYYPEAEFSTLVKKIEDNEVNF